MGKGEHEKQENIARARKVFWLSEAIFTSYSMLCLRSNRVNASKGSRNIKGYAYPMETMPPTTAGFFNPDSDTYLEHLHEH